MKKVTLFFIFIISAIAAFGQNSWLNKEKVEVTSAYFMPDVKLKSLMKPGELVIKKDTINLVGIKLKKSDPLYGTQLKVKAKSIKINSGKVLIDGYVENPKAKRNDKKKSKAESFKMTLKLSSKDETVLKKLLGIE